eukprot:2742047-Rhodomonas_salina.1
MQPTRTAAAPHPATRCPCATPRLHAAHVQRSPHTACLATAHRRHPSRTVGPGPDPRPRFHTPTSNP